MVKKAECVLFCELTSFCNFKCEFCPSEQLERKRKHLDFATGKRFLEEAVRNYQILHVYFTVLGEPLLCPDFEKYLSLCNTLQLPIFLITNISMLENEDILKTILTYQGNMIVVLSLQTPSRESYSVRHNPKQDYEAYLSLLYKVIDQKFALQSTIPLEIDIASLAFLKQGIDYYGDSETLIAGISSRMDTAEFVTKLNEWIHTLNEKYPICKEHPCKEVPSDAFSSAQFVNVAKDCAGLRTEFLPGCYLFLKSFGLWTRENKFLQNAISSNHDKFFYVDERYGAAQCSMADNLGILSNGDYVLCCLDYEGDMHLGNAKNLSISDPVFVKRRHAIRKNVLIEPVCRRCKGHIYIFDTTPLDEKTQQIEAYSYDWNTPEVNLWGRSGRWSKEISTVFAFCRIAARSICLQAHALQSENTVYTVKIYTYDFDRKRFYEAHKACFSCKYNCDKDIFVDFDFQLGNFYKIELLSPTILFGGEEKEAARNLGLAITGIYLQA